MAQTNGLNIPYCIARIKKFNEWRVKKPLWRIRAERYREVQKSLQNGLWDYKLTKI